MIDDPPCYSPPEGFPHVVGFPEDGFSRICCHVDELDRGIELGRKSWISFYLIQQGEGFLGRQASAGKIDNISLVCRFHDAPPIFVLNPLQ